MSWWCKRRGNELCETPNKWLGRILHGKLGIDDTCIERAYHVSQKESFSNSDHGSGKPRRIVAKLLDYKEKRISQKRCYDFF